MRSGFLKRTLKIANFYGLRGAIWACKNALTISKFAIKNIDNLGPIYLRPRTSDFVVFEQIYVDREYEIELPRRLKTIFDVGANIGLASRVLGERFPNAHFICIEPDKDNFRILSENTKYLHEATLLNAAIWSHNTQLTIKGSGASSFFISEESGGNVEGVSISSLVEKYAIEHIDLMKIDIEGAEIELFASSSAWIDKVGILIIELHDRFRAGCRQALERAIAHRPYEIKESGESTIIYFNDR